MPTDRPNILFIIVDHQAYYGHSCPPGEFQLRLPVFDRFCQQGTCFDRAYSVSPVCTPARASMMSGVYPSTHRLCWNSESKVTTSNRLDFATGTQLYSHHLARAGYRNAYIGKWHVGHERLPMDYGIEGWSLLDYGDVYSSDAYLQYAQQRGLGVPRVNIEHYIGRPEWRGQTFELKNPSPWWKFMFGSGVLEGPAEAHEEMFTAHLCSEKIRELQAAGQPWSLVASFWGPHQPYYPSEPYASMIDPRSIPPYPSFDDDLAGRPFRHVIHREVMMGNVRRDSWPTWDIWQQVLARCYGQTLQTDAAVGQILDTLDQTGAADNTLVVWLADHGDALATHGGLFDKGPSFIEEVARVPLAVRWPGHLPAGQRTRRLVSNMDATATLLDAAGAPIPGDMHSRSLLPLCRDPRAAWPDQLVCEHSGHYDEDILLRMIVTDRYKYVAAVFDGDELYDLQDDPYEMRNLIDSPAHAATCRDLRDRLIQHIEETGDRLAGRRLLYALRRRQSQ